MVKSNCVSMNNIGETLIFMRKMVDSFVNRHYEAWDKVREQYRLEHGYFLGESLSMQSYIGSDLTIDMAYLAKDIEEIESFVNEYWIRSQGIQCIRNESDRKANESVWSDVLGKFKVIKDGDNIVFKWFEDESCKVKNELLAEGKLCDTWF